MKRVLILDDDECRHEVFRKLLDSCFRVHVFTAQDAIKQLQTTQFDLVFLDHDLDMQSRDGVDPGCGMDVAEFINLHMSMDLHPKLVLIHSWNKPAANEMANLIREVNIPVIVKEFSVTRQFPSFGNTIKDVV
jgi:CheY-like chemotaxis protein